MSIWVFGLMYAGFLFMTFLWSWWSYESEIASPMVILLVTMVTVAILTACLMSACSASFGG